MPYSFPSKHKSLIPNCGHVKNYTFEATYRSVAEKYFKPCTQSTIVKTIRETHMQVEEIGGLKL